MFFDKKNDHEILCGMARKLMLAEKTEDSLNQERKSVFADILEAEETCDSQQVSKLKEKLIDIDREIELARERVKSVKMSMDKEAIKITSRRVSDFSKAKESFVENEKNARRQLASYLAGAKVWGEALGMVRIAQEIQGLFTSIYGADGDPEKAVMFALMKEEEKKIPVPPDIHKQHSDLNDIDSVRRSYVSVENYARRLASRAINDVRQDAR